MTGIPVVNNLIEAYQQDPAIRDRLNSKGLYLNFNETTSLTFYMTKEVLDGGEYHDFVELAMALTSNDTITILGDSPGGYLSGALMIITALNSTEAQSTCVVTDQAASAMTIIALACDDLIMTEHSHFMIHAVAFGSGGKLHEIASHTEFTIRKSKDLLNKVYENFLTPDEIEQVIAGRDFYFDADETMLRWSYVVDARESKIKALEAEYIKEQIEQLKSNLEMLQDRLPKEEVKPKRAKK